MKNNFKIHIFALASFGEGLSGGDNIFIELAKHWIRAGISVTVHVCPDGYKMCEKFGLKEAEFRIYKGGAKIKFLPLFFLLRTFFGIVQVFKKRINTRDLLLVYSASDFWPDAVPAFLFSRVHHNARWLAGFYMFAPNPLEPTFPYRGLTAIRGISYYITQLPIFLLVKLYADFVFVTSEPDVARFITKKRNGDKIIVIQGGIDFDFIDAVPEQRKKEFDAVFMGRLHPQKGILELIEIWNLVVQKKAQAKLAVIGDGYLKEEIERKIRRFGLDKNVILFGYKFGKEKVKIFKSSKVVVHPAVYDSGGMSSCEAMACGLPGVSFDLDSLKTYYPQGMVKTPCFNLKTFADNIISLLEDKDLYMKTQEEAIAWAREWDWDKRTEDILQRVRVNL